MTVADQLARLGAGRGQTHAVHHVVQTALEQREQVLTGHAVHVLRHLEIVAELPLEDAVVTLRELLGAQLLAVLGHLLVARLTVLTRRIGAAIEGALAGIAALALEEKFLPFTAAKLAHRTSISCH